jgi:5-methyltetrahydrofolate--homocysteine methyltransferase
LTNKEPFLEALEKKILLFDGAMGTEIQKFNPKAEDFPNGIDGFNDGLILTKPEWIQKIHRSYLEAGADCIETNSFGSNKLKLDEYGFGDKTVDFNQKIAKLAVEVALEYTDKPRYVIGSLGPTGFLPSSNDPDLGQIPLNKIREAFELQAEGLILGGVDSLLIETSQDILEMKLAIEGCHNAIKKTETKVPIIANTTLDQYGKMLLGTNIQAAYTTVSDMGIDLFGLNCSTGPIEMTPSIRWLNEQNAHKLLVMPNAGMPENIGGHAKYKMTPDDMAKALKDFISKYGKIRIIGGCCGTNPDHIAALRKVIDEKG